VLLPGLQSRSTALHAAAKKSDAAVVKLLLESGASVNAVDSVRGRAAVVCAPHLRED
jgi:ankyrin repeat protein